MPLVVPLVGDIQLITKLLIAALAVDESYVLKLFQNNVIPDSTFTTSTLTEANFTNYTSQTLTRAGWGTPTIVSGSAVSTYGTSFTWNCGPTGNTVYGYYVIGATSGVLLWAEAFTVPRILGDGDVLNLQPTFSLRSQN